MSRGIGERSMPAEIILMSLERFLNLCARYPHRKAEILIRFTAHVVQILNLNDSEAAAFMFYLSVLVTSF